MAEAIENLNNVETKPETLKAELEAARAEIKALTIQNKKTARELRLQADLADRLQRQAALLANFRDSMLEENANLQQYMDLMLRNFSDIIIILDKTGNVVFVSRSYLRACGKQEGYEIKGAPYSQLLDEMLSDSVDKLRDYLEKTFSNRAAMHGTVLIDFAGDGLFSDYSFQMTPMLDYATRELSGVLLVFHDITDLVAARNLAEESRNEALLLSKAKSDFLSQMSHEIRTPMNAIIGMTTIGQSAESAERKEYCLVKIKQASHHLLGIINDILDMSKIEANKFELAREEFDFEDMLQKVVDIVSFRTLEKEQHLFVKIDKRIPRRIVTDEQRLAQVITNLLGNAIKFTPQNGRISLSADLVGTDERSGSCAIKMSVTDTGIGIAKENLGKLFQSFNQADNSVSRKFGGTGLGLAISKNIIELMNGSIWIESELGRGSSFIFEIYVQFGKPVEPSSFAGWEALKLAAVEENREALAAFRSLVYDTVEEFYTFTSFEDALTQIKQKKFDIIFINHKEEAPAFIRQASALSPDSKFIIMNYGDSSELEKAHPQEVPLVAGFLQKPVLPKQLFSCINNCIGRVEQREDEEIGVFDDFSACRVLIAEDVDINREIMSSLLEETGIKIDFAYDGLRALEMFTAAAYDMVLMDINMPNMDGHTATQKIRALGSDAARDTPIVAMTANVFKEDIDKCLESGMNAHIGKPIDIEELFEVMRRYLTP
ncbi:MAG: response regulator [Clostridiales bacterium]|jgi:signal transduction histidine kinase/CheY-like chemotaxis protein|nr:response regulator [Clostridiales bacterium]